jgi:hypothetical protein
MVIVRLFDWLIYGLLAGLILFAALIWRDKATAPEPPPPVPGAEQVPIPSTSPFAALPVASVGRRALTSGWTGFSLDGSGVWATAADRLKDCGHPGVVIAEGRAAPMRLQGVSGEVALLATPGAGAPGLSIATDIRPGERGFDPGYPEQGPGEVAARLIGRRGQVLVWAEIGHTDGLGGARRGLIGAPLLDAQGRVVGVTIGQSLRRGRLYTTTPEALRTAAASGHAAVAPAAGEPMTIDNYGRTADDLRRDLSVAQLVCLNR